jgi:hypothetical protein
VSCYPPMTMLKQRHVTSCGTPEQPKGLTKRDFLNGYKQIWVSYWVCVPLPSLRGRSKTAAKSEPEETWKARWTKYQQQTCTVANDNKLSVAVRATWTPGLRMKENLTRADSTVATLLRTEHIGLNDYLCRRRVPGYSKPDCDCGWPRQTPKHIILFCPTQMTGQAEMLSEAKTTDYTKLLSTEAGLRAVTRWFLQRDILTQFSLARTTDYAKPRRRGRRPGTYVDDDDADH